MPFFRTLFIWFRPAYDAVFSTLPFRYRWRLLCLQPINLLTCLINTVPLAFSRRSSVRWIPTREGRSVRALVYLPSSRPSPTKLRPLHIDIHGGAFLGGIAEFDHRICTAISDKTGAVVVSAQYRAAPRYPYPAAHDDIDDVVQWLIQNAESEFQADPQLMTISGSSAGGNLALGACQSPRCHHSSPTGFKACIAAYASVDLRIPPPEKPKPTGFPTVDPLWWLVPLFDSYAGQVRPQEQANPRLHPVLADADMLPDELLFLIPTMDILVREQLVLIERLKKEPRQGQRVQSKMFEGQLHGWLELPSSVIDENTRTEAIETACSLLREVYQKYNFSDSVE